MENLVTKIMITIILMGIGFYVFNDNIGPGLDQGGDNVRQRIVEATAP